MGRRAVQNRKRLTRGVAAKRRGGGEGKASEGSSAGDEFGRVIDIGLPVGTLCDIADFTVADAILATMKACRLSMLRCERMLSERRDRDLRMVTSQSAN